jgi:hypothetical protein
MIPKKPDLGLDPRIGTGFRKKPQSRVSRCAGSKHRKIAEKRSFGTYQPDRVCCGPSRGRSTRKYLRMKAFSRLSSGPPQLTQRTVASTGDGASTFTSAYFAAQ